MLQSASSHSSQSGQCHLLPFKMQHVLGGLPGFASRGTRVAFTVPVARNSTFTHATSATTRGLVEGGLVTRRLELLLEALQLADDVLISTVKPRSSPLKPNECVPNTCMPVLLDVVDIIELAPLYLQRQHAPGSTWGLQRGLDPFLELLRGRKQLRFSWYLRILVSTWPRRDGGRCCDRVPEEARAKE